MLESYACIQLDDTWLTITDGELSGLSTYRMLVKQTVHYMQISQEIELGKLQWSGLAVILGLQLGDGLPKLMLLMIKINLQADNIP